MSELELNSYRFISGEEPSEEMLSTIMKYAATESRKRGEKAMKVFQAQQEKLFHEQTALWKSKIEAILNDRK